jgi:hypothetical protein
MCTVPYVTLAVTVYLFLKFAIEISVSFVFHDKKINNLEQGNGDKSYEPSEFVKSLPDWT